MIHDKPFCGRKPMRVSNLAQGLRKRGFTEIADDYSKLRQIFKDLGVKEYHLNGYSSIDHDDANRVLGKLCSEKDSIDLSVLSNFTPLQIVTYLRELGWDVTCTKTTTIEI